MQVLESIQAVQQSSQAFKAVGNSVGYVPTMGYLHEGHIELIKRAKKENDIVILSIFINPLQFGQNEDLDAYPRDREHDLKTAEEHGVDVVFYPTESIMYPRPMSLAISVNKRTDVLCGRSRPGHFEGVVTVLTKLFNICQPDRVYFGMKDAQQVAVVDALIEDFNFPVELVAVSTVREEDGLAKSSRNVNLSAEERAEAPAILEALMLGRSLVENGEKNPVEIRAQIRQFLENKTHGRIDYIELLSYPALEAVDTVKGQVILAAAVHYSKARLIDNIVFEADGTAG
ncbi:pantoate--beta-alanine ligase [Halobacillus sp. Marseille-Q1614]|uniref:pantoate--beta-alanine ligase n=1 Tax=Halobacillus sp. Marseille-Q1614 TaxID=2709134 RepID=UPI00156F82A3|nr:pantoate--beta-alanine ligase [Halobacillus sp. Marseille-Q1614]